MGLGHFCHLKLSTKTKILLCPPVYKQNISMTKTKNFYKLKMTSEMIFSLVLNSEDVWTRVKSTYFLSILESLPVFFLQIKFIYRDCSNMLSHVQCSVTRASFEIVEFFKENVGKLKKRAKIVQNKLKFMQ